MAPRDLWEQSKYPVRGHADPFPEPERTRPFWPRDNPVPLDSVDWKSRYNELKNDRNWDAEKQFVGLKRLGDSYHPLEPFFKFDGIAPENQLFDKVWFSMMGGIGGFVIGFAYNAHHRRPFFSALPSTLGYTALGLGLAWFAWNNSRRRAAERDAVLIHYMILHEKEFPRIGWG